MNLGSYLLLGANLQLFYVDYTGSNDGLFVTPKVSVTPVKIQVSLFFQATQAIVSNIEPFPGFNWNKGISYTF